MATTFPDLTVVLGHARAGRLKQALQDLHRLTPTNDNKQQELRDLTKAELLQATGENENARQISLSLLRRTRLDTSRARVELILGQVSLEQEGPTPAIAHFRKALRLSSDAQEMKLVCRSQAKLLTTIAEVSAYGTVVALVKDAERNVASFGDSQLAADLHTRIAQIHAAKGSFPEAVRHIAAAENLLDSDPNLHLLGSLNLAASAVFFFASDLSRAVEHARRAAHLGKTSGHARILMAATANLGLLELHMGELEGASQHLTESLELARKFSVSQVSLLDSYAHLQLILGRHDECGRLLDEVAQLVSLHEPTALSSQRLAVTPTRLRFLTQKKLWPEVVDLAEQFIPVADRREDRAYEVSLRVLGADALIELGRTDEAALWIDEAARKAEGTPTAVYAEVERGRAALVAHTAGPAAARRQFERALRVLAAEGGAAARMDAAGSYLRTMKPADEQLRRRLADKPFDLGPLIARTSVKSSSTPQDYPSTTRGFRVVGPSETAPLMRLAEKADLLAQEAFVLLKESGFADALAVLETEGTQIVNVPSRVGCTANEAVGLGRNARSVVMEAGMARGREFSVVALPHAAVETRLFVQDVKTIVESARALQTLREEERTRAAAWPPHLSPIRDDGVFASESMLSLLATARQIADGDESILITGESGTGKEMLARIIHKHSPRADRDFVPFNCTGVPKDMIESQLFGHRRGAFTGAQDDAQGVVRAANGGTLLLDEIGELEPGVQPKLLRFLEQREVHPLGEPKPVTVDVRVIAATNADVDQYVRDGRFREDLFYRFIIRLDIPPLRDRREEIPPLIYHFLRRFGAERGRPHLKMTDPALKCLLLYEWSGNVRQLANVVRRAVALADGEGPIGPELLPDQITAAARAIGGDVSLPPELADDEIRIRTTQQLRSAVDKLEQSMIARALAATGGNRAAAARALGISRKGLHLKCQRLGIGGSDT